MLQLMMAAIWLLLGCWLLFWQWQHPESKALVIRGTDISFAWLTPIFALYNLVRWWGRRANRRLNAEAEDAKARRRRSESHRAASNEPPDPNFDFNRKE
jgi:hypothetical protein